MTVSLDPAEAVQGGGLRDDFDGVVTSSIVKLHDYGNGVTTVAIVLGVRADDDGEEMLVIYSIGNKEFWSATPDGKGIIGLKEQTSLSANSNAFTLTQNLVLAGYDRMSDLSSDITILEGLHAHWKRVDQETRNGLEKTNEKGFKRQLLIPESLLSPVGKAAKASADLRAVAVDPSVLKEAVKNQILAIVAQSPGMTANRSGFFADILKWAQVAGYDVNSVMPFIADDEGVRSLGPERFRLMGM